MIRVTKVSSLEEFKNTNINSRSEDVVFEVTDYVREIVNEVKKNGNKALLEYTRKFDAVEMSQSDLKVTQSEIEEAFAQVPSDYIQAVKNAIGNLEKFFTNQYPRDYTVDMDNGVELGTRWSPIESIGLYVPGGKAPYITVGYMLGVPARIAGCKNRIVCVPPDKRTGKVNPFTLVSVELAGATSIYKVGGAQAIAALAFGTETIPKVEKIFGPGNVYVTAAKLQVYGIVDIDLPAGPSEALIIADQTANCRYVASDILSQAEHDPNSASVLLTTSEALAMNVQAEMEKQLEPLPKKDIIKASLARFGAVVICPTLDLCIDIANYYAPEHIQVITRNSREDAGRIVNSGSICIGEYTPIAAGDYLSGVNNVIPTGGGTKMFSPVSVQEYMKCSQVQYITKEGLKNLSRDIKILSDIEGFTAHYNSLEVRLENR